MNVSHAIRLKRSALLSPIQSIVRILTPKTRVSATQKGRCNYSQSRHLLCACNRELRLDDVRFQKSSLASASRSKLFLLLWYPCWQINTHEPPKHCGGDHASRDHGACEVRDMGNAEVWTNKGPKPIAVFRLTCLGLERHRLGWRY